jgi:hypothetical protein
MRGLAAIVPILCVLLVGCGDDDDSGGSEAIQRGIGAACATNEDCTEAGQVCLTDFQGGMCGLADCTASTDCPDGSVCVADPDLSRNYCLLVCNAKADCNVSRPASDEANCSSTLNAIEASGAAGAGGASSDAKVCRPPTA